MKWQIFLYCDEKKFELDQDLDNRIQSWNVFFDTYEDYFLMMIYVLGICLPENIHGQKISNSWSIFRSDDKIML